MNWKAFHRYSFFLLLVFLPVQLGKHFWPEWAFVLGRRVDYLSPTVYLTDILLLITLISWVLSFLSNSRNLAFKKLDPRIKPEDDKQKIGRTKMFWVSTFVFCFAGLNVFFSSSPFVALYHWLKVAEYALLVIYIMKTKPDVQTIVFPLSLGVIYSSVIAIVQFVLQHSIGGPLWLLGERMFSLATPGIARIQVGRELIRAYGTFPHPNVLGGYLAVAIPLFFNFQFSTLTQKKKFSNMKMFNWITIMLGFIALVLTFSRSAIIIFVISMAYLLLKRKQNKQWIPIFAGMTTLALAGLFFVLPLSTADESVVVRQQLNHAAIKQFISAPFVGVGLGNFLVELPKTLPAKGVYFLQPVHNIYLLVLSEMGVLGVACIIVLLIHVQRTPGFRMRNMGEKQASPNFYILPSLLAFLALGFVDHYSLTLQQGQLLFAILLGLNLKETAG